MAKVKSELEGSCRFRWDTTIQRIKPPPWHWPIVRTRTWNWLNRRRGVEKKNGGKSWKLWWYPIQVIKPPPWHWPIVLPSNLVSALWTWGKTENWEWNTLIRKDQIKWKTDYLGKCSSMTREKNIPKEPDMFKESREGLSNTLAARAWHRGSYFGLSIFR